MNLTHAFIFVIQYDQHGAERTYLHAENFQADVDTCIKSDSIIGHLSTWLGTLNTAIEVMSYGLWAMQQ